MSSKNQVKSFAENLFASMNVSEEQKILFNSIFLQAMDSMTENDFKNIENQIKEFVEKPKEESNVFD